MPNKSHAKFLVLMGSASGRALLFDGERQWVGEVIEHDGFIVDRLLEKARACPLPDPAMLSQVQPPPPARGASACCFEL
ncbi:hypothetical protein ABXN37_13675 [Piscinibacter sakaiensis]|uniref:Uncharacterized protein n=1 Tax=Piscinibacter sakaiensis TaxID=1547922 RepID=A0A0K8P0Q2_PISS1|nr:hypothetical protein [Piscinibacter sakaiensis]GAP36201.1 hypothetical protein ISF6_2041 [Piscinibacter sakaiensis]